MENPTEAEVVDFQNQGFLNVIPLGRLSLIITFIESMNVMGLELR
jgi:hypothetical protein